MEDQANKGERIAKIIARAGLASRRESEKLILDGKVKVNGKTISSPARNLSSDDVVEVDGKLLSPPEKTRIWMYHKPVGLISTSKDEKNRPTIFDKLPDEMPRVLSIGRLDLNSEGLLLLTNDGELKRRLELPSILLRAALPHSSIFLLSLQLLPWPLAAPPFPFVIFVSHLRHDLIPAQNAPTSFLPPSFDFFDSQSVSLIPSNIQNSLV